MKIRVIFTAVALFVVSSAIAQTAEIDKQKEVVLALERRIADGEKEIELLRKGRATTEAQVKTLARQVENRNMLLSEQRKEANRLMDEIEKADANSAKLKANIEAEREGYGAMVREAYREYKNNNILTYLFMSRDFQDIARRVTNVRSVAILREQRIGRIDSMSRALSAERSVLNERKVQLDSVVGSLTKQRSRLQSDVNNARSRISAMSSRERDALKQNEMQQRQLDSAIKELQKLIKGNMAGASFSVKTSGLRIPVAGGRVKQYKENMAEIVGAEGANVTTVYDGMVVDVRMNRITGKYDVYIAHGEFITSYAGLLSVRVARDQKVARNSVIGVVGEAVDIMTMQSEHKIVFGVYPPSSSDRMSAAACFR
ncbi:MAG: peptidoglycan DD-metalloendopeptidase family protein [Rikenellaceae bacterium]